MVLALGKWGHILFPEAAFTAALRPVEEQAKTASLAELKKSYSVLCHRYLSLPLRAQSRFSPSMAMLREKIENCMVAQKRVELLLEGFDTGSMEEQRQRYEELHLYFRTLPSDVQKHFYTEMVLVRNRLERGL